MNRVIVLLALVLALNINIYSQGEAAVPFLLLQSSAQMHGMGYASTAHISDDPFASNNNPAQLGMQSFNSYFSFGQSNSKWFPTISNNIQINSKVINGGINLNKIDKSLPQISIGIGYSELTFDHGQFYIYDQYSQIIASDRSYDKYKRYAFSIGIDYYIKASLGYAKKDVISKFSFSPEKEVSLYDIGFLAEIPVIPIANKLRNKQLFIYEKFEPVFNLSFGFSQCNLGEEKIFYIDESQSDPLPRYARAGMGIQLGIVRKVKDFTWSPIMFKWTIEANDILVERDTSISKYQSGLGDIKFFNEVIRGNSNVKTKRLKGWELNLLEVITLYGGRFDEDIQYGARMFNTSGWSVSLRGILKGLSLIDDTILSDNKIINYILSRFDVRFTQSQINGLSIGRPLKDTKFESINFSFFN